MLKDFHRQDYIPTKHSLKQVWLGNSPLICVPEGGDWPSEILFGGTGQAPFHQVAPQSPNSSSCQDGGLQVQQRQGCGMIAGDSSQISNGNLARLAFLSERAAVFPRTSKATSLALNFARYPGQNPRSTVLPHLCMHALHAADSPGEGHIKKSHSSGTVAEWIYCIGSWVLWLRVTIHV